ncbi:MAG: hypothetical protein QMC89_03020 [Candidatus Hodarchaeaceae archaeon]|nr:hypothetical protein [Candidatus Hodarchaeaceae archaeon]
MAIGARRTPKAWHRRRAFRRGARRVVLLTALLAFLAGASFGAIVSKVVSERWSAAQPWPAEIGLRRASTKIVAVRSDGIGVLCDLDVEIKPGRGRVLVSIEPKMELDIQYSAETAAKVASELTGIDLSGADVVFTIVAPAEIMGGPSAGAALTVVTVAAIEGVGVRGDVVITGTIREDHKVGEVGGIFEKARAVDEAGAALFLVPEGQSVITMYRQVVYEPVPGFRWVRYDPVIVDLKEYAENAGWSVRIQEVSTVEDAVDLMLQR